MQLLEQAQDGVRLSVSTPEDDIRAAAAANDSLILEFEAFRDGRGFSLAALLRGQGYRGRLIAAGKVLPDQARHLRRCGFDAVELPPGADAAPWRRMDQVFSAAYQSAGGDDRLVWRQRHAAPANDDAAELAARLNYILNNPRWGKKAGREAHEFVARAFSEEISYRKLAEVYESLLIDLQ